MKKLFLAFCLACCISVSSAQIEYPDVPLEDSAYADIALFLMERGAMEHCYGPVGPRGMTRYDFAVAIARHLEKLRANYSNNEAATSPIHDIVLSPEHRAAFTRLVKEFHLELKELGIDVAQVKINGVLLIESEKPSDPAESPSVPHGDSAYSDLDAIMQGGIIDCLYGFSSETTMTRYEFAVVVALLGEIAFWKKLYKTQVANPTISDLSKQRTLEALSAWERLSKKFLPELKALGVGIKGVKSDTISPTKTDATPQKVKELPPFSDVPKNHWASNAVEKLHQSGILIGYPDAPSVRAG